MYKEYLEKYPGTPFRTLAKKIHEEHPEISIENARTMLRYYSGRRGEDSRRYLSQPFGEFLIKNSPVIVVSDLHIPYIDEKAFLCFLDNLVKSNTKTLLLNGDIIDFYQGSIFTKDPRRPSLKDEIEYLKEIIGVIRESFKGEIIYKLGNHERRWETLIWNKAPELSEFDFATAKDFFSGVLKDFGVEVINHNTPIVIGNLHVLHGHEYGGGFSSPVNPARYMFLKAKKSVLCSHFHQVSEHIEPAIDGKIIGAWSVGCLCDLHPDYTPLNKWTHGFAKITQQEHMFIVENKKIINGQVV